MARPLEITCPKGHGTYEADSPDESCPACEDNYGANVGPDDPTIECVNCGVNVAVARSCSECGHCPGCGAPPNLHCDCRYNCTSGDDCICLTCIPED